MRYLAPLVGLTILILAIAPSLALADEYQEMDEPMMEEQHWEPWEQCWFERPWDFWRHLDEGSLDMDAVHFMGGVRKIAILPFADLTAPSIEGDSALERAGGPRRIVDNLAAEFMRMGYLVIPPPDVEAAMMMYMAEDAPAPVEPELVNNSFYFRRLPERSLKYNLRVVEGLGDQYARWTQPQVYLTGEDIRNLAQMLGADCVVRGFINEYAVTTDVDADARTFLPPFLGLLNPDRRATVQVAYYMYDGFTGGMIWNGTVEIRKDAEWPVFNSECELLRMVENEAVWDMTWRVIPSWEQLMWGHREWIPHHMWKLWDGMEREPWFMERPDWLNPMRHGWHEEYERGDLCPEFEPSETEPYKYQGVTHNYNGIRRYYDNSEKD